MNWEFLANGFFTPLHLFVIHNFELKVGSSDCNLILFTVDIHDFSLSGFESSSNDLNEVTLDNMPLFKGLLLGGPGEGAHLNWINAEVTGSKFIGEHHFVLIIN